VEQSEESAPKIKPSRDRTQSSSQVSAFERWKKGWTPLQIAVHIVSILPFLVLLWQARSNALTANPIQYITQTTGFTGIILLILSLACTPLNLLFGWRQLNNLRRPLGLYGFFYIVLHISTFFVLDYGLNFSLIGPAIAEKRFILLGLLAFVLLLPLALTSTRGWMRRLGKLWKRIHRLVYLAVPIAIVHWTLSLKADIRLPLIYGGIVGLLLLIRVPAIKRWIAQVRRPQRS
jgi:sulfoxide reductase heme-binding subunit YedZ